MITIPFQVANMIVLNKIHPVTAWRAYYQMSEENLASLLGCNINEIEKIESSNTHLRNNVLNELCKIFNVMPEALRIPDPMISLKEEESAQAFLSMIKSRKRF